MLYTNKGDTPILGCTKFSLSPHQPLKLYPSRPILSFTNFPNPISPCLPLLISQDRIQIQIQIQHCPSPASPKYHPLLELDIIFKAGQCLNFGGLVFGMKKKITGIEVIVNEHLS